MNYERSEKTKDHYFEDDLRLPEDDYNDYRSSDKFGMDDDTYLLVMHLSQLAGYAFPLVGLAAPIILWQLNKDDDEVDLHGRNIVNFILSYLLYGIVSGFLIFVGIGILLLPIIAIAVFVLPIIGGIKARNGEYWEYPFTIKFFRTDEFFA